MVEERELEPDSIEFPINNDLVIWSCLARFQEFKHLLQRPALTSIEFDYLIYILKGEPKITILDWSLDVMYVYIFVYIDSIK